MANRITVQSGYTIPFDDFGAARKKRRTKRKAKRTGGAKKQQNKMKACAVKWKRSGKRGSYRAFMKKCL